MSAVVQVRTCPKCGEVKDQSAFLTHWWCRECVSKNNARAENRAARRVYARTSAGKSAQRKWSKSRAGKRNQWERDLAAKYGITAEDWARAFQAQQGQCAGCLVQLASGRTTHVDHDHASGKFRGLLCRECNMAIGSLRDDPDRLRRLAVYVEAHRG